jgi:hypothetical protein
MPSGSTVTVFDDHCCQLTGGGTSVPPTGPSRGLVLKLNRSTHVATLAAEYGDHEGFKSEYMGDTQPLANSNTFIGWGSAPYFTEYSATGKLLLEAEFPGSDLSYRTMVEPWVGLPLSAPAGAARESSGKGTVYASWNGATQVVSWRVLAAAGAGRLTAVATSTKTGFETAIAVPAGYERFQLQALDAGGHVIGTSRRFSGSTQ